MHPGTRKRLKENEIAIRRQLVFEHFMAGGMINEELADKLAEEEGVSKKDGTPYSVSTLQRDCKEFLEARAAETRENFQEYQQVLLDRYNAQAFRLYKLITNLYEEQESFQKSPYALKYANSIVKAETEFRNVNMAIATLLGSNAPIEQIVTHNLNSQIESILIVLKQGLGEDMYGQVANVLHNAMGLSQQNMAEQERSRLQKIEELPELEGGL